MAQCGPALEAACATCSDRDTKASLWLMHIDGLYMLKEGGYPFQPDDLPLEVWHDLGLYKKNLEAMKWATPEP